VFRCVAAFHNPLCLFFFTLHRDTAGNNGIAQPLDSYLTIYMTVPRACFGQRVPFPVSDRGGYGGKLRANVYVRSHAQLMLHKILRGVIRTHEGHRVSRQHREKNERGGLIRQAGGLFGDPTPSRAYDMCGVLCRTKKGARVRFNESAVTNQEREVQTGNKCPPGRC